MEIRDTAIEVLEQHESEGEDIDLEKADQGELEVETIRASA